MNWKTFVISAAAGALGGYAVCEMINRATKVSPNEILEQVKKQFKQVGPINGSWIYTEPESFEKDHISYQVYKGGISRNHNGEKEQYEFIADASTGTILMVRQLQEEAVS